MPERIQRKRTKGSRLPPNTKCVTPPSRWANPFRVDDPRYLVEAGRDLDRIDPAINRDRPADWIDYGRALCLHDFRKYAEARLKQEPTWLDPLREMDFIACYCKPSESCHGDILIDLMDSSG